MELSLCPFCSFGVSRFPPTLTPGWGACVVALPRSDGLSQEALPGLVGSWPPSLSSLPPAGGSGGSGQERWGGLGVRRREPVCPELPLLPPGTLLIVVLPSQGVVSKASCRISMGLLLPAGRAASQEAWRWSLRGTVFLCCPAQPGCVFLDTPRQPPLSHCCHFFFFFIEL